MMNYIFSAMSYIAVCHLYPTGNEGSIVGEPLAIGSSNQQLPTPMVPDRGVKFSAINR